MPSCALTQSAEWTTDRSGQHHRR